MTRTHRTPDSDTISRATRRANDNGREAHDRGEVLGVSSELPLVVTYDDFFALSPTGTFIFRPDGSMWAGKSLNQRLPWKSNGPDLPATSPASWLQKHKPVEQVTWAPGEPELIRHRLLLDGGWIDHPGASIYNFYRPPTIERGDPRNAVPWLRLAHRLFGRDAPLVIDWCAHRVQYPGIKINHALLLGGDFGIGKDTLLEPVIQAIGPWNSHSISPSQFIGRFNGHLKSVLLRIAEARDGERFDRYAFYDAMKLHAATPPDTVRIDEKNRPEYDITNVVGILITANRKSAFHLEPGDRRHAVAWSRCQRSDFADDYFDGMWKWYHAGGFSHVAAYLAQRDLAHFNPKAPPRKTDAFHDIVNSARPSEDAEMADALDKLTEYRAGQKPRVITMAMVRAVAPGDFAEWLSDRKNRRLIAHRFEANGYTPVRNPDRDTGLWVLNGQRQVVYGLSDLDRRTLINEVRLLQATVGGNESSEGSDLPST